MRDGNSQGQRRQFLLAAASLAVGGVAASMMPWRDLIQTTPSPGHLLRGGFFHRPINYPPGTFYQAATATQRLAFEWDLDSGKNRIIESSVPPHIADTHPIQKNLSVLGTQKTEQIALVDWDAGRQIASMTLPNGHYFYGHSVFTECGTKMLAPVFQGKGKSGLAVFDFPSLQQTDFIHTERGAAHEICALGNELFFFGVTTRPNTPSAVGVFDYKNRSVKYIETGFGNGPDKTVVAHVKDCGSYLITNVQKNGKDGYLTDGALISFDKKNHTVKTVIDRGLLDFNTDMLSLDFDSSTGYAWITVPYQSRIEIWDMVGGKHVRTLKFPNGVKPTAISRWDAQEVVIVTTADRFLAFDSKTAERREHSEQYWPHKLLDGGHCAHTRIVSATS